MNERHESATAIAIVPHTPVQHSIAQTNENAGPPQNNGERANATLAAWQGCLEQFPDKQLPGELARTGRQLMTLERFSEAENMFRSITVRYPDCSEGYGGLAQVAAKMMRWEDALASWQMCLERFPERTQHGWLTQAAQALMALERIPDAETMFASIAERYPERAAGFVGLAQIATKRTNWEAALAIWQDCLERFPEQAQPRWFGQTGHTLMALERNTDAETLFRSTIQRYPEDAEAYVGLARLAAKRMDWDAALAAWRECLERFPEQAQPGWFAETGRMLIALGRVSEAENVIRSIIERYPDRAEGTLGLVQLATMRMDWEEVLAGWQECFNRFPKQARPTWFAQTGRALMALERDREAESLFRSTIVRYPDRAEGYLGLALIAAKQMNWMTALAGWQQCLNRFPGQVQPGWFASTGRMLMALERIDEAEALFRSIIVRYPSRAEGHVGLAQIATKQKSWNEALAGWRHCIERFPAQIQPGWFAQSGRILINLEQIGEAENTFQALTVRYPERAEGYVGLAQLAGKRGDWEASLEVWQDCLQRFPRQAQPSWFAQTGRALITLERVPEAETMFRSMIARYPKRVEGHAGLARVAGKRMDWRSSLEHWDLVANSFADEMTDADKASRAQAYTMTGHFDSAEQILAQLTESRPDWPIGWIQRASNATLRRDEPLARRYWASAHVRFRGRVEDYIGYQRFLASLSDEPTHIIDDYRDVGEDATRALRHIDELSVSETGARSLFAARHYARVFPDSAPIHVAAVRHARLNIKHPADLTDLLDSTRVTCGRFANSKPAWLERARALICANRLELTKLIVTHIEKLFGRCAHTDEINAWIAQAEGDFDRARIFSEKMMRESYSFALHGQLQRFERIDSNQRPRLRDKILLFCVVRDEIGFLPWFFDYYRSLGVDWFFVVDNGSTDGSRQWLCRQSDATVFWTDDNFHGASSGMRWINELLTRYGDGNWCLFVDADEQLVVPGLQKTGLRPVVDYMQECGDEVMFGFMLDMYPDKGDAFSSFCSGDDPQEFSPLFDPDYFVFGDWQAPYRNIEGGARDRLFNTTHKLRKAPIVRGGSGVRYLTNHTTTAARVSEVSGALLHYKILREGGAAGQTTSIESQPRVKDRGAHCKLTHDRYHRVLEKIDLGDFPRGPNALTFESADQLVDVGLIKAIPGKEARTTQHPALHRGHRPRSAEHTARYRRSVTRPADSVSLAGLARASAMQQKWDDAIQQWRDCFDRFPTQAEPDWLSGLAQALIASGRHDEAIKVYRQLVDVQGQATPYVVRRLSEVLIDAGRSIELIEAYRNGVLRNAGRTLADLSVVGSLWRCNRMAAAREIFDLVVDELDDAAAYERRQALIPTLFDGAARSQRLLECEAAICDRLGRTRDHAETEMLHAAQLSALLALRDYPKFESCASNLASTNHSDRLQPFLDIRRRLRKRGSRASEQIKIFGIGLSKTGTTSLAAALEILGLSTIHFVNPLTRELISDDDFHLFDAFLDTPVSFRFEKLIEQFPTAKFIYTKRPMQSWLNSFANHFARNLDVQDFDALRAMVNHSEGCRHGELYRAIHNNLYCDHPDATHAYRHHEQRVQSFFHGERRDRLLEFDIFSGDGWVKLCRFVGRTVPDLPFPWENQNPESS